MTSFQLYSLNIQLASLVLQAFAMYVLLRRKQHDDVRLVRCLIPVDSLGHLRPRLHLDNRCYFLWPKKLSQKMGHRLIGN